MSLTPAVNDRDVEMKLIFITVGWVGFVKCPPTPTPTPQCPTPTFPSCFKLPCLNFFPIPSLIWTSTIILCVSYINSHLQNNLVYEGNIKTKKLFSILMRNKGSGLGWEGEWGELKVGGNNQYNLNHNILKNLFVIKSILIKFSEYSHSIEHASTNSIMCAMMSS